jgi:hypothetical protein
VYDQLRNSPVYQTALRAPSAANLHPVTYLNRIPERQWADIRVQQAGIRLDHLMCNILPVLTLGGNSDGMTSQL